MQSANFENRAISRTIKLLETVSEANEPVSAAEISRRSGLHRATAHRLLAVLCDLGYVHKDAVTKTYMTGFYLHTLGRQENVVKFIVCRSANFLTRCALEIGAPAYLGVLQGVQVVIRKQVLIGEQQNRVHAGTRLDAHANAIGKALLAYCPAEELRLNYEHHPLFAHTPRTVRTLGGLTEQLKGVRALGYAISDQEEEMGWFGVATPILNPAGRATCAIGVRGQVSLFNRARQAHAIRHLKEAAESIRRHLTGSEYR
jgi:DNA-binding IclR family transcriptional regulator